jgi:hypothetical protein
VDVVESKTSSLMSSSSRSLRSSPCRLVKSWLRAYCRKTSAESPPIAASMTSSQAACRRGAGDGMLLAAMLVMAAGGGRCRKSTESPNKKRKRIEVTRSLVQPCCVCPITGPDAPCGGAVM